MSEEIKPEDFPVPQNELCEIIDSAIYVLQSLDEFDKVEDAEDITLLRKHSYKLIYAAQRKLLQVIKAS